MNEYLTEQEQIKAKNDRWWWLYFMGLLETLKIEYFYEDDK